MLALINAVRHSLRMRYLILLLLISIQAQADQAYYTRVSSTYRLSCERTMLRIYDKYGAPGQTPEHQEKLTVKYCSNVIEMIEKAHAWKEMASPAGTACDDAIKAVTSKPGYPSQDALYKELCAEIAGKDG